MFQLQQSLIIYPLGNNLNEAQQILLKDDKIVEISAGQRHILIITSNRILGMGSNQNGQLGVDDHDQLTDRANFKSYVQINTKFIKSHIKQVSCGWNHSLLLDNLGIVYSAGQGQNGALGYGRGIDSYEFKPISIGVAAIQWISAGKDHSLALSSTKVYGWGNSQQGQLGLARQQIFYSPQQLLMYASQKCYAGPKYSIFVSQKNQIYVTGWNENGQLGLGHQRKVKMVKKITGVPGQIIEVSGSSSYSIFKTLNKQIYLSGTGCFGKFLYPTKIKYFSNCQFLQIGETFGLFKNDKGSMYTWDPTQDISPNLNQTISRLNIQQFYIGPKLIVCKSMENCKSNKYQNKSTNQFRNGNKSPTFHQNEGTVQNRKAWNDGLDIQQLCPSSLPNSIQNRKLISIRMNEEEESDYNPIKMLKKKPAFENNNQNIHRIEFDMQNVQSQRFNLGSPYFRKQLTQQQNQNPDDQTQRNLQSNTENHVTDFKISSFKSNEKLQKSHRILNKNCNSTSKTLCKQKYKIENNTKKDTCGYSQNNQTQQVWRRLQQLKRENIMKDQYIKHLKAQFLQVIQIMDSRQYANKISQKGDLMQAFKLRQQHKREQYCGNNTFFTNLKQIRDLLGAGITSLNYELS